MVQYNNPQLGRAFEGLAAAFAPPSASDVAGYARAGYYGAQAEGARAQNQQLADLMGMARNPDAFDQDVFDRSLIALGVHNPQQGYYGVDTRAGTAQRGQDIDARTSLAMNAADNARALQQTQLRNQADLVADRFGDISQGDLRPAVPEDIAAIFDLPAMQEVRGADKPLTESQQLAAERQELREGGMLPDDLLLQQIMSEYAPVEAVGPDGNPVFMSRGEAVQTGAQPAASGEDSAAEARINRLTENLMATGDFLDPAQARNVATGIVDGRLKVDRDPVTRNLQVVDMATGQPAFGGRDAPTPPSPPTPPAPAEGATPRFGNAQDAFGVEGFGANAINTLTDAFGMGRAYPEAGDTISDFRVLRENLLNDIASAYNRQPPSWLLQEIRGLTPGAGDLLEGPEGARSKLQAIERQLRSQLSDADNILARRLDPKNQQEMEMRKVGLETALSRIGQAIAGFGGGAPEQAAPPAQGPQPGDVEDGFRFLGGDPGNPDSWERVE